MRSLPTHVAQNQGFEPGERYNPLQDMQLARAASACSRIADYCPPIDSSDGERVPLQYFPICAPSGESIRSIRVAARQAQDLQCDVISCAVYDCLLRKDG
jgi:hypothetical protein